MKHNEPPASNYATADFRNGHRVLDFDSASDEIAVFKGIMPLHYAGTIGVEVILSWVSPQTTGNVVWMAAFEKIGGEGQDIDSESWSADNSVTEAPNTTSGIPEDTPITFTDGGDMDDVAAGQEFRLRITRDANNASDTLAGDAELLSITIKES